MKLSLRKIATRRPSFPSGVVIGFLLGLIAAFAVACGTEGKKEVAKTALSAMSDQGRAETFEGTLRVLDEHPEYIPALYAQTTKHPKVLEGVLSVLDDNPEYVDQAYALIKKHDKALDRAVADASVDLKDKPLAELAAQHVVEQPDSLENVMVVTLPIVAKSPKARAAMNRALIRDAEVATDILTDDPATLSRVIEATLPLLEKKQAARKNVLAAVHKDRAKLIAFVKSDPELTKDIGQEFIKELVKDKPTVEKMLRTAKIIDDAPVPPPPAAPKQ